MTKQVVWTKAVIDAFIVEGNLNERQQFIIRSRADGMSITKQAEALHLSIDQINKEIARLKKIYDIAQKNSKILPERRKKRTEIFN